MGETIYVYVGTYTKPGEPGIFTYTLNPDTGELTQVAATNELENPSFLNFDQTGRFLYATNETSDGMLGSYAIDENDGSLTFLNKQSTHGQAPCFVIVERSNQYALVANYTSGKGIAMLRITSIGGLSAASDAHEHMEPGTMVNPSRQERSHAHSIVPDPTNTYAAVPDLGLDKVFVYKLDLDNGKLIPHDPPFVQLNPGSGPRHIKFHPDGKHAYVIEELSSAITVLNYDGDAGTFEVVQTISTLPDGVDAAAIDNTCAEVLIALSGKFVYGSNRGHHSLAIFSVDPDTAKLTPVGHQSTLGETPRNFNIDPTGQFIVVANQNSNSIVTFRMDAETGLLTDTGFKVECHKPVCVKFLTL